MFKVGDVVQLTEDRVADGTSCGKYGEQQATVSQVYGDAVYLVTNGTLFSTMNWLKKSLELADNESDYAPDLETSL